MDTTTFNYLVFGLGQYLNQQKGYPYPSTLQYAMDRLAVDLYPDNVTVPQLLALCESPLKEWWKNLDALPDNIDERFGLLYNGALDEQVVEYLLESDLMGLSEKDLPIRLESALMGDFRRELLAFYHENPVSAQKYYVMGRQFIIQNPFTTARQLNRELSLLPQNFLIRIRDMYKSVDNRLYHEGAYWNCPICGPLYPQNSSLAGKKQSLCEAVCPTQAKWKEIRPSHDLLVLKEGLHLSTLIPGIYEIELFEWLTSMSAENNHLVVQLWPGVDRYDLRIVFPDNEAWAIDVKDYRSPAQLAKQIDKKSFYSVEESLYWDKGFFVIPVYHIARYPGYLELVKQRASLIEAIDLTDTEDFKVRVQEKMRQLR